RARGLRVRCAPFRLRVRRRRRASRPGTIRRRLYRQCLHRGPGQPVRGDGHPYRHRARPIDRDLPPVREDAGARAQWPRHPQRAEPAAAANRRRSAANMKRCLTASDTTTAPTRREFMLGAGGAMAASLLPAAAAANVPVAYDWNAAPPVTPRSDFIDWMVKNRGEDRGFLGQRWDRFQQVLAKRDLW